MMNSTISNLKWFKRERPLMLFLLLLCCVFQGNAQLSNVTSSHIGNTFNGGNNKWVQNYAEELDVASDGTIVTGSAWDEAGRCVGIFKDGQPVALLQTPFSSDCWGWGTATEAAALDDNYVYVNNCKGDMMRFNRNSNYAYVDKVQTGIAFGMTHSGGFLYMIQANGLVQKRSVSNLGTVALSFTVTGGYDLAVDATGSIWVLTTNKEVIKYSATGANTGVKIAAQSGWKPHAVNYDAFNNVLLVPDNGPRRQVIKFNTSGAQVGTFGDAGGISSGTKGTVGDLRFWNISGCGTDAAGNVYVALSENSTSLRKFNASGVKQWEVQGTMFTDIATIDPASDGNDMYTINEHLKFNYSTQQWSMAAMTVDAIGNPTDPRNVKETGTDITSAIMRRVNGNLVMFTTGMFANEFFVYRFVGEVAVFCQSFKGWAALPDKDGNIWYEDGQIKKIPLTGFNNGVPVFGAPVVVATSYPAPITSLERLEYDVDKDVMYIGGFTDTHPEESWGLMGSTILRYPNWSTGNRIASHTVVLPRDSENLYPKAMSVANDYIFVTNSRDRGKTYVYNSSNLSSVGYIAPPTNMGLLGWIDIPHAVQAFKKSNGQYVILVEDNLAGKNIIYQWCPTDDCDTGGVPAQGVIISPETSPIKEGLTFQITPTSTPFNVDYSM